MKSETEFVLERAAWPALLLQESGTILKVNHAARQIFGPRMEKDGSLASFWAPSNGVSFDRFLATHDITKAACLRLYVSGRTDAEFRARLVKGAEGGRICLLLQLFRTGEAAGSAAAPSMSEHSETVELRRDTPQRPAAGASLDAALEEVEWPAMLVRKTGKVLHANRAATRLGSQIETRDANPSEAWPPEGQAALARFLTAPTPEPVSVAFHLKNSLSAVYTAQIGGSRQPDVHLVQLFRAPAGNSAMTQAARSSDTVSATEAHLQKQKLDCALQLARSVALDFNNALTSILGHTSLLLSKAETNHPWRGSLVEIEKSAAKAAETANDLAAFSRQEKDSRQRVTGNLNTLLERTVEAFRRSITGEIKINQHLESKLFTANFDEAKMQQALVRIFENAVEAMPSGGQLQVQTRNLSLSESTQDCSAKLTAGNYVCVEISDSGRGIAADVLPRIFEPFFTTKGGEHRGVGLAWVYGIVTNHGGSVAVSSTPLVGTSVRVYLPANRKFVREIAVDMTDLRGAETILMVDDEDMILTLGQTVLSAYGYTVLTANSGKKALEMFAHWKDAISLIVTDLVMPGMSGRELTEQILRVAPDSRILWTSGYVRSSESQEPTQYLQKPFTSQELLRKIKQALS